MTQRYITPSKITAWLGCAHYLGLRHEVEAGLREAPTAGMGSFARLLADKGLQHEQACLEDYQRQGLRVRRVPDREQRESFAGWVSRVGDPFAEDDWDVLYQMPLIHDGIRGIADFLLRTVDEDGQVAVEPVDAKLARQEAKPGHVLQLCFYADAIEARMGRRPSRMHLWLGSGQVETLAVQNFSAYWRRLRSRLAEVLDLDVTPIGSPEPCEHCAFCEFSADCDAQWRREDSLVFVAGLRSAERAVLRSAGVETLAGLAAASIPVDGLSPVRQPRLVTQAALQQKAREDDADGLPFLLVEPDGDGTWGHGFAVLPEPDEGDVFLDFEGHPFWRADAGLFFLFGLIEQNAGDWEYRAWWAHDLQQEGAAALALIDYLVERRQQHPGMHVYHYNHTERSSLERLARDHGVGEVALAQLVDTGAFVDLLLVARCAVQVGAESYGLKSLELLTGYQRGHDIDEGAGAVVAYEQFMIDGAPEALTGIAAYNEDDVRATRAVRDWLVSQRPADLPWRAAVLEPADEAPELDEQIAALHAFGAGTAEHLLGDVLGYWRREWYAHLAPLLARCIADADDLRQDPEVLVGLAPVRLVERTGKNGRVLKPALRLQVPEQDTSGLEVGDQVLFPTADGPPGFSSVLGLDTEAGVVDLAWDAGGPDAPPPPTVVVRNGWVSPRPKPAALSELAGQVLDPATHGQPRPGALALLQRRLPTFLPGKGPAAGRFSDDLHEMLRWTIGLDGTCVAVQGPPGTGKTFRGARQIHALIKAGKRVGITAFSHHAIDNLLEAVIEFFRISGDLDDLRAARKGKQPRSGPLERVTYTPSNAAAAKPEHNLVAGTTWLFAGNDMAAAPVDVLVIDEAGQMSLADALSACRSADNLLLLGDPLQLPQVAQASHPAGSGRSSLEHVLGEDATMPPQRGVFLSETRRMHPDVCGFISQHVYEGRLTSHPSCAQQNTKRGTGLRWLRAEHTERSTHSEEEAEIVRNEIVGLLGTSWTDQHGVTKPLEVKDVLVVAPYNDQVDLLRECLHAEPRTRGIAVGTVDKFQGREAAVVFFSMATSSSGDMSRTADFLFSRNRFNVAVSRARCLAYLVCTEALLNSRGHDVEEMRLISILCAFAEADEEASSVWAPEQLPRQEP